MVYLCYFRHGTHHQETYDSINDAAENAALLHEWGEAFIDSVKDDNQNVILNHEQLLNLMSEVWERKDNELSR
jgi:hypothetical protein